MQSLESKVISGIDPNKVVELTKSLVKIPSINPPGEEHEVSEFIASWFDKRGRGKYAISKIEAVEGRPNLVVQLNHDRKGRKTLILNGHMDVVPVGEGWSHDPFGGEVENGRIYGRGVADMKGALAAMMIAMESLSPEMIDGSISLVAVVDEEKGGHYGSNQVAKSGISGDFVIIGEPTEFNLNTMHKGNLTFDLTTIGKAAHASNPAAGINAILKMHKLISGFDKYAGELRQRSPHPLLGSPTFNVGVIHGGVKSNVVPDRCTISAERRLVLPEKIPDVKEEIQTVLRQASLADPDLKYELKFTEEVGPSEAVGGKDEIGILLQSLKEITGKSVEPSAFTATCDAYHFNTVARIPTVICGPGSIKDIHKPDESVDVNELASAAKLYALTALRMLGRKEEN